jgi:hypothetical protein
MAPKMTMTAKEKEILYAYIKNSKYFLEFGSGNSTVYAAGIHTIKRIDSVESSFEFVEKHLKNIPIIKNAIEEERLHFFLVNLGETIKWGYPQNHKKKHLWPNYPLGVFSMSCNHHDLVLIDGRFRVASTLSSVLSIPTNSHIIIHDFWNRPQYHILLQFLTCIEKIDTIGVFVRKKNINVQKAQALIKRFQYIPNDRSINFRFKMKLKKIFTIK